VYRNRSWKSSLTNLSSFHPTKWYSSSLRDDLYVISHMKLYMSCTFLQGVLWLVQSGNQTNQTNIWWNLFVFRLICCGSRARYVTKCCSPIKSFANLLVGMTSIFSPSRIRPYQGFERTSLNGPMLCWRPVYTRVNRILVGWWKVRLFFFLLVTSLSFYKHKCVVMFMKEK